MTSSPPASPVIKQRRVSEPVVGWLLVGAAALMVISGPLPWATVLSFSVAGTVGAGKVTMFFGLLLAAFGVLIGTRHGRLWVSITGCVLAALATLIALSNMGNISSVARERRAELLGNSVSIGVGLWLTLAASLAALALSIVGIARRPAPKS
jgi:hypothetical protein